MTEDQEEKKQQKQTHSRLKKLYVSSTNFSTTIIGLRKSRIKQKMSTENMNLFKNQVDILELKHAISEAWTSIDGFKI